MPDSLDSQAFPSVGFPVEGATMRYSRFVPRLYNLCLSLGMRPGLIMPSRAFCSDENQGYPIILIAKHFGGFPFNHGQVGGIVSTERHQPHAEHGEDMVLIQASHVGYDPGTGQFGAYRRLQTRDGRLTPTCGKIDSVLRWYMAEYRYACRSIGLYRDSGQWRISIDNQLLNPDRAEGLFLRLEHLVADWQPEFTQPVRTLSTRKIFNVAKRLQADVDAAALEGRELRPIGALLRPAYFRFQRAPGADGHSLEQNLLPFMPRIVTAAAPLLLAAQINTQMEFDRVYRSIARSGAYRGQRLLLVAGLHIDISPEPGQLFPLTKFVPWAACWKDPEDHVEIIEQAELLERLRAQSLDNPARIDLERSIAEMAGINEVTITTGGQGN